MLVGLFPSGAKAWSAVVRVVTQWTEDAPLCSLCKPEVLIWLLHPSHTRCHFISCNPEQFWVYLQEKQCPVCEIKSLTRCYRKEEKNALVMHFKNWASWSLFAMGITDTCSRKNRQKYWWNKAMKRCLLCLTYNTFTYFTSSITTVKCNNKQENKCANEALNV